MMIRTLMLCAALSGSALCAQTEQQAAVSSDAAQAGRLSTPATKGVVPPLMRYSGVIIDEQGNPRTGVVPVTFALYEEEGGGAPRWLETQNLVLDENGRYTVVLGVGRGIPVALFATGEPRWMGVRVAEEGAAEQRRVRLVSVPYALTAANSDSLGGRPVTDFMLTPQAQGAAVDGSAPGVISTATISNGSQGGIANRVARFEGVDTIVPSALIFDNGSNVGIGTTSPTALFHVNAVAGDAFNLYTTTTTGGSVAVYANHSGAASIGYAGFFTKTGAGGTNIGLYAEAAGAGANYAAIFQGGNVGIGTNAPSAKLQVNGVTGDGINAYTTSTGGGSSAVFASHTGAAALGYGGFFSKTGAGTTNIGLYATASGATNNYAGLFPSGSVGIGTSSPTSKLEVVDSAATQTAKIVTNTAGVSLPSVGVPPPTAIRGDATSTSGVTAGVLGVSSAVTGRGVLGMSLASTGSNAGVFGQSASSQDGTGVWGEARSATGDAVGVFGSSDSITGTGVLGEAKATSGDAAGVAGISRAAGGTGVLGEVTATSGENYAVTGRVFNSTSTASTAGMFINNGAGSLILGRNSTAAGTQNVFRVSTTGAVFGNGAFNTTGADFAESVAVKEHRSQYQPGDVIAIDTTGTRRFAKSATSYSTLVAGIYSTRPGVLASPHPMEDPRIENEEIPLAVVGIVPCKVINENGAIKAGDLLVSSSREGYAMKGTDQKRMNGAVIGKALQDMKGATGVIEVLVSLQ